MNHMLPSLCVIGDPPPTGQPLTRLLLQHHCERGQVTDQVNVGYLCFDERWYRFYFECGTLFWRACHAPVPPENAAPGHGLILNDLSGMAGVVGHVLEAISGSGSAIGDVTLDLGFAGGQHLRFAYSCSRDSARLVG